MRGAPTTSLSYPALAEQLFYQVFHPFSTPFVVFFRGHAAVRNMRLGCCVASPSTGHAMAQGFQWMLIACLMVVAGVTAAVLPRPERAASPEEAALLASLEVEVAAVFIAGIFQRIAVATKWAYLPPARYASLMRVAENYEALAEDQLLAGWAKPTPALVEAELEAAGVRAGFSAHSVCFTLTRAQRAAVVAALSGGGGGRAAGGAPHASTSSSNPLMAAKPMGATWTRHTDGRDIWYSLGEETSWELPPGAEVADEGRWSGAAPALPVSAFSLARRMVLHAVEATAPLDGRVNMAFLLACAVNAFLPAIVRGAQGMPAFGRGGAESLVLALTAWLNFLYPFIVMSYIRVGIVDYHRRAGTLEKLVHMASRCLVEEGAQQPAAARRAPAAGLDDLAGDEGGGGGGAANAAPAPANAVATTAAVAPPPELRLVEPAIPLGEPGNAVAWLATRRLLLGFGARYVARVEAYASQALLLSLGLSVALLLLLFLTPGTPEKGAGAAPTGTLVFSALGLYALLLLGAGLVVMLRDGARANNAAAEHAAVLTARGLEVALRAEGESAAGDAGAAAALGATERVLGRVGDLLRAQAQLEPITILGLPASDALLRTILAGFASVVSVLAQQAQRKFGLR